MGAVKEGTETGERLWQGESLQSLGSSPPLYPRLREKVVCISHAPTFR